MIGSSAMDDEISDAETAFRWIGVQASVDISIAGAFAYHMSNEWGIPLSEPLELWNRALAEPELKFLILMPAVFVFFQVLRRFGSEELPNKQQAFETDPIVKFLGGAAKVRNIRDRWLRVVTIKS